MKEIIPTKEISLGDFTGIFAGTMWHTKKITNGKMVFFDEVRQDAPDRTNVRVPGMTIGTVNDFGICGIALFGPYPRWDADPAKQFRYTAELSLINRQMLKIDGAALCTGQFNTDFKKAVAKFESQKIETDRALLPLDGGLILPVVLVVSRIDTIEFSVTVEGDISDAGSNEFTAVLFGNATKLDGGLMGEPELSDFFKAKLEKYK